jgi:formate--tetrahydrofolate ligase
MKSDIEIAREARMRPVRDIGSDLGIPESALVPYGHTKAKISLDYLASLRDRPRGKLILVTAMSPTPAGEGKTTVAIGLTDAMNRLGQRTSVCLREPSLGPCFGLKGGAAGGGLAQVVPMEDINLHFTGDMHAIGAAHNLLAAMIDNYVHWSNDLRLDLRRVTWRRVVDINDRQLRQIVTGAGGPANRHVCVPVLHNTRPAGLSPEQPIHHWLLVPCQPPSDGCPPRSARKAMMVITCRRWGLMEGSPDINRQNAGRSG